MEALGLPAPHFELASDALGRLRQHPDVAREGNPQEAGMPVRRAELAPGRGKHTMGRQPRDQLIGNRGTQIDPGDEATRRRDDLQAMTTQPGQQGIALHTEPPGASGDDLVEVR